MSTVPTTPAEPLTEEAATDLLRALVNAARNSMPLAPIVAAAFPSPPQPVPVQQALTDEELGRLAYKGYDDYWTEDCRARESEAWTACAKAVLASQAREPEWRAIDSAPKDGTLIMLGARNGVWLGKYVPVYQSGYLPENPWASMMLNHDHMAERYTRPTHWKPLDRAPQADAPKEGS